MFFYILDKICMVLIWGLIIYGWIIVWIMPSIKTLFSKPEPKEFKIYLDDERQTPAGWFRVYNYTQCISLLETTKPTHLSLDHDLGEEKTGYNVVNWIEAKAFLDSSYHPPIITIHSANPAGRQNMQRGIDSIKRIVEKRNI